MASYPRSGNTWIRLLLSDIILQNSGTETSTGGNIIPDMYKDDIAMWDEDTRINFLPFRIIKTHEPYAKEANKIIYIFRNPADALCSYYYYVRNELESTNKMMTIDEFCWSHIYQWCWHIQSYITAKQRKPWNVHLISYESLQENSRSILKSVANFCGLKAEDEMLQIAIENQEFKQLQNVAQQPNINVSSFGFKADIEYNNFFRRGQISTAKEELSPKILNLIQAKGMGL